MITRKAVRMDKLEIALDDLDGLLEAYRALSDDARDSALRRSPDSLRQLQREIAAAADAYAATLIASAGGDVSTKRINKCRKDAQAKMMGAVAKQEELASLVNQQRLPSAAVREDVKQLVTLSLHCRAALAALAPTVDRRAAEALANKVLVELRQATLLYLASARDSGDRNSGKPRAAVVALLEKTEGHAAELAKLAPGAAEQSESLGAVLSKNVSELLRKTAQEWEAAAQKPAG
jgi:hypothetical protein